MMQEQQKLFSSGRQKRHNQEAQIGRNISLISSPSLSSTHIIDDISTTSQLQGATTDNTTNLQVTQNQATGTTSSLLQVQPTEPSFSTTKAQIWFFLLLQTTLFSR